MIMKIKEIYTCMVAALSVFCACSSEMDPLVNAGTTPGQLTFTANDFEYEVRKKTSFNITPKEPSFNGLRMIRSESSLKKGHKSISPCLPEAVQKPPRSTEEDGL